MLHVAIVEDEPVQRRMLSSLLARHGFRVSEFAETATFLALLRREMPDLVLLDVRASTDGGHRLVRHVRQQGARIGIILLAAAGDSADVARGLDAGADDQIAHPPAAREVMARVRGVLRRLQREAAPGDKARVPMGVRVLDLERRVLLDASGRGEGEQLTAKEFQLLRTLAANSHRPLEREWLAKVTSGGRGHAGARSIDLRVARLRRKIERVDLKDSCIRSVRGVGYMFVPGRE